MNNSGNFEDQDPDYAAPGPSTSYQQKIYEETARTNTSRKITSIIDREFSREIDTKEKEILEIQEKLDKALKTLHFLRYVIISDFYNRKQCLSNPPPEVKQVRLHPAVRSATGKSPKVQSDTPSIFPPKLSSPNLLKPPPDLETPSAPLTESFPNVLPPGTSSPPVTDLQDLPRPLKRSPAKTDPSSEPPRKIPRYVPPKTSQPEPKIPSRGVRHKSRKRIVVGNISKWIPPDWREDAASHKWTMYVRGTKEDSDISDVVSKVRFFLHPSYRPNDVVDVISPPFHLCRRGWGEFPLRVQLHFKNRNNKPMDIIHHLKLDRTYTGLQTLGSETVVDIWINTLTCELSDNKMVSQNGVKQEGDSPGLPQHPLGIKEEKNDEDDVRMLSHVHLDHDYASLGGPEEGNVTIAHSPEKGNEVNHQNRVNGTVTDSLASLEAKNPPKIIQNGGSPRKNNSILNSEGESRPKIIENGSSVLEPLKITIPSHFQSLNVKKPSETSLPPKIVVLKDNNDRVIKLDMNTTKKAISLLKNPRAAVNLVLDSSKSVILNSSTNIPVLKIADSQTRPPTPRDKPNGKFPRGKVTIGKDKTKLGSKKELYDGILKSLEEVKISSDVEGIMRFIMKRMPIVSPHSGDPEYRRLHPYVCGSDEEFLGFNPGKQRALEWYRAKEVRSLLRKRSVDEEEIWTVKEIMLWCRLHGFTPVRGGGGGKSEIIVDVGDGGEEFNTCTEPVEFMEWLQEGGEEVVEDEEEVDVVEIGEEKIRRGIVQEDKERGVMMEVPKSAEPIYSYVCGSVRQVGVKLAEEEVAEGVLHNAAGRVLAKAVECFMENLLRCSLAQSFERTGNGRCPEKISLEDVRAAIASRDEFDIFTNNGLGTQNAD
ncbi:YEATS domain-containing protein 2 [Diachasmimorpha longicaudata]|uniref:YEATS domain-containing protein 2 n=1 Tax=Diachasmimorpha longicaudata TaxID=58733 RepID=UPI0030B8B23A